MENSADTHRSAKEKPGNSASRLEMLMTAERGEPISSVSLSVAGRKLPFSSRGSERFIIQRFNQTQIRSLLSATIFSMLACWLVYVEVELEGVFEIVHRNNLFSCVNMD